MNNEIYVKNKAFDVSKARIDEIDKVVQRLPLLTMTLFKDTGYHLDIYGNEQIERVLGDGSIEIPPFVISHHEINVTYIALMIAKRHIDYERDLPLWKRDLFGHGPVEIIAHGIIHDHQAASLVNYEQGTQLITSDDRMQQLMKNYMVLYEDSGVCMLNDVDFDYSSHKHSFIYRKLGNNRTMLTPLLSQTVLSSHIDNDHNFTPVADNYLAAFSSFINELNMDGFNE